MKHKMIYIRDIIDKKRRKEALTEDEISFFIYGYFKEEISEAQAAALLTAIHIYGLSEKEMTCMINAISKTGEELEFYRVSNKITDIHSLGGISDKIILILISIINSLGLPSAKIIGRELGMEDRLISLPNYKIEDNIDAFKQQITDDNIAVLRSLKNLAPIEEKLYKLRYAIACDSNIQLIATSIMSQKVALGCSNIFFEITYGKNAYVKTLNDAKELSKNLVNIGSRVMRNVGCCITSFEEPIGRTFGNILELKEVYDALNGDMSPDIQEMVIEFGTNILNICNFCKDRNKSKKMILNSISNGSALSSFEKLLTSQGGDISVLRKEIKAEYIVPVTSIESGYIEEIDVNKIRMLAKYLDAIRNRPTDELDIGAGLVFNKKVGDKIESGGILGYVYTNNKTKIEDAVISMRNAFIVTPKKIKQKSRVEFNI